MPSLWELLFSPLTDGRAGPPLSASGEGAVRTEASSGSSKPLSFLCRREAEGRRGAASYSGSVPGQVSQWLWQEKPLLSYCEGQDAGLQGLGGSPGPERLQQQPAREKLEGPWQVESGPSKDLRTLMSRVCHGVTAHSHDQRDFLEVIKLRTKYRESILY